MQPYSITVLLVGAVLLGGCTVYVPVQPVMPLVTAQNPVELNATVQPNGRVEVTGAYAPLPHVLLTGAATVAVKWSHERYLTNRQGEVGIGTYWEIRNRWLLNGIAGVGTAYTERNSSDLFGSTYNRGNYQKIFGQVGIAYKRYQYTTGITYRLGWVSYHDIQHGRYSPTPDFRDLRHELGLFYRYEVGNYQQWYLQAVAGASGSSLQPPGNNTAPHTSEKWFAAGVGVPFLSIGAGWRPGARARKIK